MPLFDQLGTDVPDKIRTLIVEMTYYDPNDRADLAGVRGMLAGTAEVEIDKVG